MNPLKVPRVRISLSPPKAPVIRGLFHALDLQPFHDPTHINPAAKVSAKVELHITPRHQALFRPKQSLHDIGGLLLLVERVHVGIGRNADRTMT